MVAGVNGRYPSHFSQNNFWINRPKANWRSARNSFFKKIFTKLMNIKFMPYKCPKSYICISFHRNCSDWNISQKWAGCIPFFPFSIKYFLFFHKACYYICNSSLNNLSRKAEGNGPVKPWQPCTTDPCIEGANSIAIASAKAVDKSEIQFDKTSYLQPISSSS